MRASNQFLGPLTLPEWMMPFTPDQIRTLRVDADGAGKAEAGAAAAKKMPAQTAKAGTDAKKRSTKKSK